MNKFLSFLVGVLVGVAGYWLVTQSGSSRTITNAERRVQSGASNAVQRLKDNFDSETIREELARTGKVIREKAGKAGEAIADATANARITASIKAKLVQDEGLTAFKIDVDTTDGRVTLSGTVSSHDQIARAIKLALETDGVRSVVSTLQVKQGEAGA